MTFYNNKVIAIEKIDDGIYLARKNGNNIYIDYVKENTNILKGIL